MVATLIGCARSFISRDFSSHLTPPTQWSIMLEKQPLWWTDKKIPLKCDKPVTGFTRSDTGWGGMGHEKVLECGTFLLPSASSQRSKETQSDSWTYTLYSNGFLRVLTLVVAYRIITDVWTQRLPLRYIWLVWFMLLQVVSHPELAGRHPQIVIEKAQKIGGFPNAVGKTLECVFSTFLRVLSLILNSELPRKSSSPWGDFVVFVCPRL